MTWLDVPLTQDQIDVIVLVNALVGKHGPAPGDERPVDVAKARRALADAGLWALGAAEEVGGGGAPLQLRLTALAALGAHWAALAWASAQAHAAVEILGGHAAWGELLQRITSGGAAACVVDLDSARVDLGVMDGRILGTIARLDPAGVAPHVLVLVDDSTVWVLPPDSLRTGPALRRAGMAGACTSVANVTAARPSIVGHARVAEIRARLQLGGAAIAAGISIEAAEQSLEYARSRIQFGAALTALPTVRQSLFGQAGQAADSLAVLLSPDPPSPVHAAAALAENCARAVSVAAAAVQSHGGYGYLAEYGVERLLRDAVSLRAATDSANGARAAAALLAGHAAKDTEARPARR